MADNLDTRTLPQFADAASLGLLAVEPDLMLARDLSHALLLMLEKLMPQSGGPYHNFMFDTRDIAALHRAAGMAADAAAAAAEQLYQGLENDRVGTP